MSIKFNPKQHTLAMREYFEKRELQGEIKILLKERRQYWTADKANVVSNILAVVDSYKKMGYKLSLRQLYYQLVKANVIPNEEEVYKRLSGIVDDCRYSGRLDWAMIEDRGRVPKLPSDFANIDELVDAALASWRLDRQQGQPKHIELWTEKDAISGILYKVTQPYHVRLVINKGYTSSSAAYSAYERFVPHLEAGRGIVVLYFGDHDPSGLDMVRDITDRLLTFISCGSRLKSSSSPFDKAMLDWWQDSGSTVYDLQDAGHITHRQMQSLLGENPTDSATEAFESGQVKMYLEEHNLFKVIPIGLTMDQVKQYRLPPNPAKITDPRAKGYIQKFGQKSWEVDALNPQTLSELVANHIEANMDAKAYNSMVKEEESQAKVLKKFLKR